jgi:hypothetical protein
VPGPLWLWRAGPGMPDLDLIWRACLHRFDTGHTYRFAGHALGWDKAALRRPEQVARRTWTIIAALTQLRRPARPPKTTGTPASAPKPSKAGPGRPEGRTGTPATRHPVIKKAA